MNKIESFTVEVVTPHKVYEPFLATKLIVTTDAGEINILSNHAEYIANVEISPLTIYQGDKVTHYAVGGGAIRFDENKNKATLILNSFKSVEDINLTKIEISKKKWQEKLLEDSSTFEHKQAELHLKRIINEMTTKNNYKDY